MKIIGTQYSLKHRSLDIYLAGCSGPHCVNCHNPESWDFDVGDDYKDKIDELNDNIREWLVSRVFILGGEPLDQNEDELEDFLSKLVTKEMWLFTRKEIDDVPERIKKYFKYIKTGRYIEELRVEDYFSHGIQLKSSNQQVISLTNN
jgi:anaerobic ribonucleoside-triphosphate reductase activating protein